MGIHITRTLWHITVLLLTHWLRITPRAALFATWIPTVVLGVLEFGEAMNVEVARRRVDPLSALFAGRGLGDGSLVLSSTVHVAPMSEMATWNFGHQGVLEKSNL
ncbi:hypothetical protein GCK72_004717 [Caenorhabditis remanei]|uniref:Uncharacterized protein n=1 Tax=Caenorhabditis remanei TaxID=31234 RepID=A0A6A5HC60_CAERE|nr:hypothetical protein GCK72_004717 [Caenorhabditis remanei]KAF1764767.1 hypothetical protein GCK72_004717 [Caenorhabditis remanei]